MCCKCGCTCASSLLVLWMRLLDDGGGICWVLDFVSFVVLCFIAFFYLTYCYFFVVFAFFGFAHILHSLAFIASFLICALWLFSVAGCKCGLWSVASYMCTTCGGMCAASVMLCTLLLWRRFASHFYWFDFIPDFISAYFTVSCCLLILSALLWLMSTVLLTFLIVFAGNFFALRLHLLMNKVFKYANGEIC